MTSLSPASTAVEDGKYDGKGRTASNKPPIYKRKKIIAAAVLAAVVITVVTVTVPVVVLRNKNRHYSTGIKGAFEMKRATGPYTDVVVFGDGHADNGRPREEQYAPSRAPNSDYWVSVLAQSQLHTIYLRPCSLVATQMDERKQWTAC